MSKGPSRPSTLPRRTGQLSLLTLALLASGACSLPALAAEPAQASSPRMGDYRFSIAQQPLVEAINAFSKVTGWQVGFSAELADGVASPGVQERCQRRPHSSACSRVRAWASVRSAPVTWCSNARRRATSSPCSR